MKELLNRNSTESKYIRSREEIKEILSKQTKKHTWKDTSYERNMLLKQPVIYHAILDLNSKLIWRFICGEKDVTIPVF